ncbi:hypothetical protein Avbf_09793 [Armadillidium vulgare]|nr:hypothetical protein Avbf_09793 [Armadillidium vulgare]
MFGPDKFGDHSSVVISTNSICWRFFKIFVINFNFIIVDYNVSQIRTKITELKLTLFNGQTPSGRRRRSLPPPPPKGGPKRVALLKSIFEPAPPTVPDAEVTFVHANNQTHRVFKRSLEAEFKRQKSLSEKAAKNPILLVINLDQIKRKTRILTLQPAVTFLQINRFR